MKRADKFLLLVVAVLLIMPVVQAQKEKYTDIRDAIFSARQLNAGGGPRNVTWIEEGSKFSFTRTNQTSQEMWTRTMKSGKEEKVFTNEDLTFPGTE
ncbi:MAG: hypothetical protein K8R35_11080, partial [Bacteroidales bacterium]|nr:hypothetical protein [Bacteroidales bacterium]